MPADGPTIVERIRATPRPISPADYARLGHELAAADTLPGLQELRVGILSGCSLQFISSALAVEGATRRLRLRTHFGPFGQFEQQVAVPGSSLHAFEPDALVLMMRPEDVDPDSFPRFHAVGRPPVFHNIIDRLVRCIEAFRAHSAAPVLVANFALPAWLPLGPFDGNSGESLNRSVADANAELRERLSALAGAAVWDYAGLVRYAGADRWCDPRLWALARIPVASDRQPLLARHLVRTLAGIVRPSAKCLALDLDNTLWGGVIGDDGMEGIQLGDDYPGNVFKSFQRAILGLADRGILLAVVSKNDADVVQRALRDHPEMLIRPQHLSATRVNWEAKSQNLREIAAQLNIGLDAIVHFDDNPMERAEIAANAPEVQLVDVPADPLGYERALHECGYFDTPAISDEDRRRVQMYGEERARTEIRATARSVHAFLNELGMVAEIGLVDDTTISRVAQLLAKTNQFNLTTRRHTQAEISRISRDPQCTAVYLRLRDRFGDLGLIAVALLAFDGEDAVIDSLVMSCRAMGREVERALAAELVELARARGCRRLVGEYLPTARNGVVAQLYSELGFAIVDVQEDGSARYALDLAGAVPEWPASIARQGAVESTPALAH